MTDVLRPDSWDTLGDHDRRIRDLEASPAGSPGALLQTFTRAGVLTVANGNARWYPVAAGEISFVHVAVGTAPTGSSLTVRIKLNGASVGTVSISASGFTKTFVPSTVEFVVGDYFTVDVTAVGSTIAGSDLVVQFWGTYR